MAQAMESNQRILYVGDQDDDFVTQLPSKTTTVSQKDEGSQGEGMSIAWRYKHLMSTDEAPGGMKKASLTFDLSQLQTQPGNNITSIIHSHEDEQHLSTLFDSINARVQGWEGKAGLLVMHSFASPFSMIDVDDAALVQFLSKIKSMTKRTNILTLITMPTHRHSFTTSTLLADCVFSMTPMDHEAAKRYEMEGFLRLIKPCFAKSSMKPCIPTSTTLAYKIKRRRLTIEPFYLPPELNDNDNSHASLCSSSITTNKDILTKNPSSHLEF